eukprot:jgi/Mesvir1/27106/Mv20788-RA.1
MMYDRFLKDVCVQFFPPGSDHGTFEKKRYWMPLDFVKDACELLNPKKKWENVADWAKSGSITDNRSPKAKPPAAQAEAAKLRGLELATGGEGPEIGASHVQYI